MRRIAALFDRLVRAVLTTEGPASRTQPTPRRSERATRAPARRRRSPSVRALEQLAMDLGPARPRWSFSRLAQHSPHHARIVERIEFVRRFYPELEGVTIRIGLAQKRGVLGWGSLDPERPGIWVRPRKLSTFTIAHEFTHLLQARELVPKGERQCDLWALARHPLLVDGMPTYLKLPRRLRQGSPSGALAHELSAAARRAIAAREAGERRYLQRFERELAERFGP